MGRSSKSSTKNLTQIKKLSNVQKRHLKDLQKDLRTVGDQMKEIQKHIMLHGSTAEIQ